MDEAINKEEMIEEIKETQSESETQLPTVESTEGSYPWEQSESITGSVTETKEVAEEIVEDPKEEIKEKVKEEPIVTEKVTKKNRKNKVESTDSKEDESNKLVANHDSSIINLLKYNAEVYSDVYEAVRKYRSTNYTIVPSKGNVPSYAVIITNGKAHYCMSADNFRKLK